MEWQTQSKSHALSSFSSSIDLVESSCHFLIKPFGGGLDLGIVLSTHFFHFVREVNENISAQSVRIQRILGKLSKFQMV
jgi:hypothetical protein